MVSFSKEKLEECLLTGYLSDHAVLCGGYRFKLHRLVLEEKAQYLANLALDHEIVRVSADYGILYTDRLAQTNLDPLTFSRALRFIYLDEFDDTSDTIVGKPVAQKAPVFTETTTAPSALLEVALKSNSQSTLRLQQPHPLLIQGLANSLAAVQRQRTGELQGEVNVGKTASVEKTATDMPQALSVQPISATTLPHNTVRADILLYFAGKDLQIADLHQRAAESLPAKLSTSVRLNLEPNSLEAVEETVSHIYKRPVACSKQVRFQLVATCANLYKVGELPSCLLEICRAHEPVALQFVEALIKSDETSSKVEGLVPIAGLLPQQHTSQGSDHKACHLKAQQLETQLNKVTTAHEQLNQSYQAGVKRGYARDREIQNLQHQLTNPPTPFSPWLRLLKTSVEKASAFTQCPKCHLKKPAWNLIFDGVSKLGYHCKSCKTLTWFS